MVLDTLLEKGLTAFGKVQFQMRPPKVTAVDIRAIAYKAKSGMVICRKYNYYLDSYFIPGEYTHSGILETDKTVIHAIAAGVERIDIIDFIKDADGFCLLDVDELLYYNRGKSTFYAITQLGKPYDFKFDGVSVTAFFCHELTAKCLEEGGIKIPPMLKSIGPLTREIYTADQFISDKRIKKVYECN